MEFWNLVKRIRNYGKTDPTGENVRPSEWLDHFKKLLTDEKKTPPKLIDELKRLENIPSFSELDVRISKDEIDKALDRLNKKASHGPDKIHPKFLLLGRRILIPYFTLFFNKLFAYSYHMYSHSLNHLVPIRETHIYPTTTEVL